MKWQNSFAETQDWRNMVEKTYRLKAVAHTINQQSITLYDNGKYLANAPYITDGGAVDFGKTVETSDFIGLKKPVLVKSRKKIAIKNGTQHVSDENYLTYVLDVRQGKDFVWNKLIKSKTRNQIRKTEKAAYRVKTGKLELLDDFYDVISTAWRDLGTPTHSKKFYQNIITELRTSGYQAKLMVLYVEEKPASAACLIFNDETLYHPYAATLKAYNRFSLNNALYWNIILFSLEKNIRFFDMGRSHKKQGTAAYKLSWGAAPVPLYYYYFNTDTQKNEEDRPVIRFLSNAWKLLPKAVANFLGPKFIYKVLK